MKSNGGAVKSNFVYERERTWTNIREKEEWNSAGTDSAGSRHSLEGIGDMAEAWNVRCCMH